MKITRYNWYLYVVILLSPAMSLADMPEGDCEQPLPGTDLRHCSFSGQKNAVC